MPSIDCDLINFYTKSSEETRLTVGLGPLEFERNKHLISRYLATDSLIIADVGGGPGHYSKWLAELGYQVTLIDPVPKHIQQAKKKSRESRSHFNCLLGEARDLPIDNNSVDLIILHGPLYHLQEHDERMIVLKEARRVLKRDGIILGFAITHAASTLAVLQQGLLHNPKLYAMCRQELKNGEHFAPEGFPGILTDAFFHRPSLLVQEFKEAGFLPLHLLAVEGIVWLDKQYFNHWANSETKTMLLELLKLTEEDPELLCLSPHIMLAAEKKFKENYN